jgi:UDP-N-acetylglucosamine 2-epimerase
MGRRLGRSRSIELASEPLLPTRYSIENEFNAAGDPQLVKNVKQRNFAQAEVKRAYREELSICDALTRLQSQLPVILPLHPRARAVLSCEGWLDDLQRRIQIIEPVGYLEMLVLEKHARLVATDSGGVQKEAFFFHVPCVTLREETEWTELVDLGWNRLAPPADAEVIVRTCEAALSIHPETGVNPYGDGRSAERIVEELLVHFASTTPATTGAV